MVTLNGQSVQYNIDTTVVLLLQNQKRVLERLQADHGSRMSILRVEMSREYVQSHLEDLLFDRFYFQKREALSQSLFRAECLGREMEEQHLQIKTS